MARQALIVIDIQNDYFAGGKWPLVGVEAAADNAARLIQAFRHRSTPVVHIRHEFGSDDAAFFTPAPWGAIACQGPQPGDEPVVLKHFVNAFRETELQAILQQREIEELVIVGNMSHMCVEGPPGPPPTLATRSG